MTTSKRADVETVVHCLSRSEMGTIISRASCTADCIAPILEIITRRIGFDEGVLTTMHAYESSRSLVVAPNQRRRGRSAAADITFRTTRKTSLDEVNQILSDEVRTSRYDGVIGVSRSPFVSSDIVGHPHISIIDLELTKVVDEDLVEVVSWYDNDWKM